MDKECRRRSYAFGELDSPRIKNSYFRRRTRSMRSLTTSIKINIPVAHLRGSGFSSYHVYKIEVHNNIVGPTNN